MPVLSINDLRLNEEAGGSNNTANFDFAFDAPVFVDTRVYYFTSDGSATSGEGDYFPRSGSVVVRAGESGGTIPITVYRDDRSEGDETFSVTIVATPNVTLPGGAPAVTATATILDDDDGVASPAPGVGGAALLQDGPDPEPGSAPTIRVHDARLIEADGSSQAMRFLVTLDRPAPSDITFDVHTQDVTAVDGPDYFPIARSLRVDAGSQAAWIDVSVYGDTAIESDETFDLILTNVRNGVFEGGAAALRATGTILDEDGGPVSGPGGIFGPADAVPAPDPLPGPLPTLRLHDVAIFETDGSSNSAQFLLTLDGPAPTQITGTFWTQDGTATMADGDYFPVQRSFTIAQGATSTYLSVSVYGDQAIEGDETFSLLVGGVTGADLEGQGAVLQATGRIVGDDGGPPATDAGIGGPADVVDSVSGFNAIIPTLTIRDVTIAEGDASSRTANLLLSLDRPAPTDIGLVYTVTEGNASLGTDVFGTSRSLTIPAGDRSALVGVSVYGDTAIEGDEFAKVVFTGLRNAVFVGNAPAVVARVNISDDEGATAAGGLGRVSDGIEGPAPSPVGPVLRILDTSIAEGDGSSRPAYVVAVLSEPAETDVTVRYQSRDIGGGNAAEAGADYFAVSPRTLTIPAGQLSAIASASVYGDTDIEGNEAFEIVFDQLTGARFEGGDTVARVAILGDDGQGTAGASVAGPAYVPFTGPGPDDEVLTGTAVADRIDGLGGNDSIAGLAGDDRLLGNEGDDTIDGGTGVDVMIGGPGSDLFFVDRRGDTVIENRAWAGTDEVRSTVDYAVGIGHVEVVRLQGNAVLAVGNQLDQTIHGNARNNVINGGRGDDTMIGGAGNDAYSIIDAGDRVVERAGEGTDLVRSFLSHRLADHVERLFLLDVRVDGAIADLNGYGNAQGNFVRGNGGDNRLGGREGKDFLVGKAGADAFVFDRGLARANIDRIVDFSAAEGDTIEISTNVVGGGLTAGVLGAGAFHVGAAAADAADRFIYNADRNWLLYDGDGSGAGGAVIVATFAGGPVGLQHDDIVLF